MDAVSGDEARRLLDDIRLGEEWERRTRALFRKARSRMVGKQAFQKSIAPFLGLSARSAEHAFRALNVHKHSMFTEDDFVMGMAACWPTTPHSGVWQTRRLFHIFSNYDESGTGELTYGEFQRLVRDIEQVRSKEPLSEAEIKKLTQERARACVGIGDDEKKKTTTLSWQRFHYAVLHHRFRGTSALFRLGTVPLWWKEERKDTLEALGPFATLPAVRFRSKVVVPVSSDASEARPHRPSALRRVEVLEADMLTSGWQSPGLDGAPRDGATIASGIVELLLNPDLEEPRPTKRFALLGDHPVQSMETLCKEAILCLKNDPVVLHIPPPAKVYGDIHGQLRELLLLWKRYGAPDPLRGDLGLARYVFLGDYVDRGPHSLEVFSLMLALKVLYPKRIIVLRGNHEDGPITTRYGFRKECMLRLGEEDGHRVWSMCVQVFDWLPIAAIVGKRVLCIHGGIGTQESLRAVEELNKLDRPCQVEEGASRMLADVLWSDPTDHDRMLGVHASSRQIGVKFGPDRVRAFLQQNPPLQLIVRAHQCIEEGYEFFAGGHGLTVFSATNYGGAGNKGAFLEISDGKCGLFWCRKEKRKCADLVCVPKCIGPGDVWSRKK